MQLLCVGNGQHAEMLPLSQYLAGLADIDAIHAFESCAAACAFLAENSRAIELVVIYQRHSDEYSLPDVQLLMAHLPLSRWVCCCGVWCESDGRNRDIWPVAMRVPARVAIPRIHAELEVIAGRRLPLPWTASIDERFCFDFLGNPDSRPVADDLETASTDRPLAIHVQTVDRPYRECLTEFFGSKSGVTMFDLTSVGTSGSSSQEVLIRDIDPICEETWAEIASARERWPDVVLVGLASMAHRADHAKAAELGIAAVVDKLAPLAELWATICRVAGRSQHVIR